MPTLKSINDDDPRTPDHDQNEGQKHIPPFSSFVEDPDFQLFEESYQKGNWEQSENLLKELIERYPGTSQLEDYQNSLHTQHSLRDISQKHSKEKRIQTAKGTARLTIWLLSLGVLAIIIFVGVFLVVGKITTDRIAEQNYTQLGIYSSQVQQLLLSGQPETAQQLIEKMKAIDPSYASIQVLENKTNQLTELFATYNSALDLVKQGKKQDALALFQQVETTQPGLWDVTKQIELVQNSIKIDSLFAQASAAYQASDWQTVITSYEAALVIDPKLDDPVMKEQLLNGYLRSIIQMLESDNTTIEDIDKAEGYYRNAVAMIPQSKAFASERENLREVSSSLLELKFTQIAKNMLIDPSQTVNSVAKAVDYLNKASNLNPQNTQLQTDLTNAQLYQIGFKNFVEMNWAPAIDNLNRLVNNDRLFANGNATILLYEAYTARGNQNFSVGIYLDARKNFEQAEILAGEDPNNPIKLFQADYLLGNTLGKLRDYKGAVSYYQYALNEISIYTRLSENNDFSALFYAAEALAQDNNFADAYNKYFQAMDQIQQIYVSQKVDVTDGECLAFLAEKYQSTIMAIQIRNSLSKNVTVTFGQTLDVPKLGE
jgi:tetratricopeptide (TPR) repeat protein